MISLKAYCEPLARLLGTSSDALYERQRILSRNDFFSGAVAGKGPGSGVRASPSNIAKLLLSVLATDALADVPKKTVKLSAAKSADGPCPITGATKFLSAIEKIISDESLAESIRSIEVFRLDLSATITSGSLGHPALVSRFGVSQRKSPGIQLEIIARLPGWGAQILAGDLERISRGENLPSNWHGN